MTKSWSVKALVIAAIQMEKKIEQHIKGIENFKKDDLKHAETQIRERLPSKEGMYWKTKVCSAEQVLENAWQTLLQVLGILTSTLLNTPLMGGETARINHLMEKY